MRGVVRAKKHATTDDDDDDDGNDDSERASSLLVLFLVVLGVLTRRSRVVVLMIWMMMMMMMMMMLFVRRETKTVGRCTSHILRPDKSHNNCITRIFVSSIMLFLASAPKSRCFCVFLVATTPPRRRRQSRLSTFHRNHRVLSNRKCHHRSDDEDDVVHRNKKNRCEKNTKKAGGTLKRREVMETKDRRKLDERDDALWYARPRFCTHVDDGFLEQLTRLYRQRTTPEFKCLDLCASHVSHYPYAYAYVLGHGLNREELERNEQFRRGMNAFFVRNFNEHPVVDAPDRTFDMVSMCVSIQYMQRGEELFREIFRVLKPGGVAIISYSNRMFYEKAVSVWRDGTGYSRTQLVKSYFQNVNGFTEPEVITEVLPDGIEDKKGNPFVKMMKTFVKRTSSDPFYAVVSYRNFKRT